MRLLVWQWGRRGAGPRFAAGLVDGMRDVAGVAGMLSLSSHAELLQAPDRPDCALAVPTYEHLGGFALQWALAPRRIATLTGQLRELGADVALCAMSGPLDLLMVAALRRVGIPFAVVVHDADPHPGDGFPFQMTLQRALVRRADALVTLTGHVANRLRAQGLTTGDGGEEKPLIRSRLPLFAFGPPPPPPCSHRGPLRLLCFGRLLPYKGLDLLAEALAQSGARAALEVRVVGSGPESQALDALRALPGVTVENRWVPEGELGALIAWADAMVLPYREASQSGAGAAAIAAGRWVVATRVGGMAEQFAGKRMAILCEPAADSLAAALTTLREAARRPMPMDTALPSDRQEDAAESLRDETAASWRDVASGIASGLASLRVKV